MPTTSDNHEAHDYAERIRERLPRRLQEMGEEADLGKYALARKAGVSRDMPPNSTDLASEGRFLA